MRKFIELTRKIPKYIKGFGGKDIYDGYHVENMKISPDNILFLSQQDPDGSRTYCTKLYLLNGTEVLVMESLGEVEKRIEKFYKDKEKENVDKIVISKDDIVKNFIFRNLG